MFRKIVLPILAVLGFAFAIYIVNMSSRVTVPEAPLAPPALSTFTNDVAGAGLIEASTQNIRIGTTVPGVVTDVYVKVGDVVKAGETLFKVEDREQASQMLVRQAELFSAEKALDRLVQQPRAEDLPPLEAAVKSAEATFRNRQRELERVQRTGGSASGNEIDEAKLNLETGQAELDRVKADLARVKAGAWTPEIEISKANIEQAKANLQAMKIESDRRTVRAPVAGKLLQVNIRVGEFAQVGPLAEPLMLLGDVSTLHIRVDIDENDAWRVRENKPARASVRGNSRLTTDLKFVRIEPFVVPKRSLTGESSERVDTRVLQVLYAFDANAFEKKNGSAVYVGQQMDVFIEALPSEFNQEAVPADSFKPAAK